MKLAKYFLTIPIVIFTLSGCVKAYTCRCDGGALGNGMNVDIEAKNKQKAEEECNSYNSNGVFSYHNCRLQ